MIFFIAINFITLYPKYLNTPQSFSEKTDVCNSLKAKEEIPACNSLRPLTPLSTINDVIKVMGLGDPGSYALAAKSLINKDGLISLNKEGFFRHHLKIWAPGLMTMESIIYLINSNAPLGFILLLISNSLWAILFSLLSNEIYKREKSFILSGLIPFSFFLIPDFKKLLLTGVYNSDVYGISLFLIGLTFITFPEQENSYLRAKLAGLFFALAAYFRVPFEIIMELATILFIVLFSILFLKEFLHLRVKKHSFEKISSLRLVKKLAGCLIIFHLLTFPYRAWHHFQWIDTKGSNMWHYVWQNTKEFPPELMFFVDNGTNVGCLIDKKRCDFVEKNKINLTNHDYYNLTIKSWINHPIKWLSNKIPNIYKMWKNSQHGNFIKYIFIIFVISVIRLIATKEYEILFFFFVSSFGTFIPMLVLHAEERYFWPFNFVLYYLIIYTVISILPSYKRINLFFPAIR